MMNKKEFDENKVAFIMCVNDIRAYNEAVYYINNLDVPDDMSLDIIKIEDAKSMCSGYNYAMNKSDAKYKVYIHQDVYIVNKRFIYDIINVFKNEEIGMIGMIGSIEFPPEGVMWYGERCGNMYASSVNESGIPKIDVEIKGKYMEVEAIDGFMMATSVDIPWREDIFKGWDFYDISHSREMIRSGKKVVVSKQESPWCIHNDGITNLSNYFKNRELFLNEYSDVIF